MIHLVEPLKIAICEDTKSDEEKLLAILSNSKIPNICSVYESGEALLEVYHPQQFDLLLTDIYMGGITGIDAVTKIREIDSELLVAFVTTSTEHALEGYRLDALKYIEKPFQEKDVEDILNLAKLKKDNAPALIISKNGKSDRIPFSAIVYLEQHTHHLNIHLKDEQVLEIHDKLSTFLPQLEAQNFFSSHKSFAVNPAFIRSIDRELKCFVMQGGHNVPIRRESMGKAKRAWEEFLFQHTRGITL